MTIALWVDGNTVYEALFLSAFIILWAIIWFYIGVNYQIHKSRHK